MDQEGSVRNGSYEGSAQRRVDTGLGLHHGLPLLNLQTLACSLLKGNHPTAP